MKNKLHSNPQTADKETVERGACGFFDITNSFLGHFEAGIWVNHSVLYKSKLHLDSRQEASQYGRLKHELICSIKKTALIYVIYVNDITVLIHWHCSRQPRFQQYTATQL